MEDVKEGNVLIDYLLKIINESGLEQELCVIGKSLEKVDNEGCFSAEDIMKELLQVVKEPLNYVEDLLEAIYMGILINDTKKDGLRDAMRMNQTIIPICLWSQVKYNSMER